MSTSRRSSGQDAGLSPGRGDPVFPSQLPEEVTSIASGTVAATQSTNFETAMIPAVLPALPPIYTTPPSSTIAGAGGQPGQASSSQTQQVQETSISPSPSTSTPVPTAPAAAGAVSSPSSGNGLSNGAVAGIAIGT
jgi:hypothetical protein